MSAGAKPLKEFRRGRRGGECNAPGRPGGRSRCSGGGLGLGGRGRSGVWFMLDGPRGARKEKKGGPDHRHRPAFRRRNTGGRTPCARVNKDLILVRAELSGRLSFRDVPPEPVLLFLV